MPLQVLHVVRSSDGGMRSHVLSLAAALSRVGAKSTVAAPTSESWRRESARLGVPFQGLPARSRFAHPLEGAIGLWLVARLALQLKPDVVHFHGLRAALLGRTLIRWTAQAGDTDNVRRPAVLATIHGPVALPSSVLSGLWRRWEARQAPDTDRFICVSQSVAGWWLEQVPAARGRVVVIPGGVNLERFQARPGQREAARKALAASGLARQRGLVVGAAARLAPEKGIDVLLRAWARLAGRQPEAELWIAGRGPESGRLERLARFLGLAERVRWLGHVPDMCGFYAALDLFVAPSRCEGQGLAALEAMAMGLPVVASATGGLVEWVRHGATGLLVTPSDPVELEAALLSLLEDASLRARLGAAAADWCLRQLSSEATARQVLRVYEDALGMRASVQAERA